jgi:hypothetical protein
MLTSISRVRRYKVLDIAGYWTGGALDHIAWDDDALAFIADGNGYYFFFSAGEYDLFHTFRLSLDGNRLSLIGIKVFIFQCDILQVDQESLSHTIRPLADVKDITVFRISKRGTRSDIVPALKFSHPFFHYKAITFGLDQKDVLENEWHRQKIEELMKLGAWA